LILSGNWLRKEDELDGKSITHGEHEKCMNNLAPNYMEIIEFREPVVDGMLKRILRMMV
jgi:hypothetical protein